MAERGENKGFEIPQYLFVPLSILLLFVGFYVGYRLTHKSNDSELGIGESLVYYSEPVDPSEEAVRAAREIYSYLENWDLKHIENALKIYDAIIPKENVGSEIYTLRWLCSYLLAPLEEREEMLKNKDAKRYIKLFSYKNFKHLKNYIGLRYALIPGMGEINLWHDEYFIFLDHFHLFNSPAREDWEKTEEMIDSIGLEEGDSIADVGCGPGFYTFRFSERVGDRGKVYAIDTIQTHLEYIQYIIKDEGLDNIEPILSDENDILIPEDSVDYVFMCSLYHIIYGMMERDVRLLFMESIKRALKKGGFMVISDNSPRVNRGKPYSGPRIAESLILDQLKGFGFDFIREFKPIPQRYLLFFKLREKGGNG